MPLKQLNKRPEVRLPRIERTEAVEINSEESHLWAVSYSDLLMVLMSFFIIFFSVDEKKRQSLIQEITIAINSKNLAAPTSNGSGTESLPNGTIAESISQKGAIGALSDTLTQNLSGKAPVTISGIEDGYILIQFAPNSFSKKRYQLDRPLKVAVSALLDSIRPFADKVNITFIGHADAAPILATPGSLITDNYVLSALRANEAMRFAIVSGLPSSALFIQGSASNTLNSRTLSVRIDQK